MTKTIPKKKKHKKGKWLSEEAIQIAKERREVKEREKRKDILRDQRSEFQRTAKTDKKAFLYFFTLFIEEGLLICLSCSLEL